MIAKLRFLAPLFGAGAAATVLAIAPMASADTPSPAASPANPVTQVTNHIAEHPGGGCVEGVGCGHGGPGGGGGCVEGVGCGSGNIWEGGGGCVEGVGCGGWRP